MKEKIYCENCKDFVEVYINLLLYKVCKHCKKYFSVDNDSKKQRRKYRESFSKKRRRPNEGRFGKNPCNSFKEKRNLGKEK